jgi:hypothetical protein
MHFSTLISHVLKPTIKTSFPTWFAKCSFINYLQFNMAQSMHYNYATYHNLMSIVHNKYHMFICFMLYPNYALIFFLICTYYFSLINVYTISPIWKMHVLIEFLMTC